MNDQLVLLVHIVQPDGFVQLQLRCDRARIALLVDPLDRERLLQIQLANRSNLLHEILQQKHLTTAAVVTQAVRGGRLVLDERVCVQVNDRDEARVVDLHLDVIVRVVERVVVGVVYGRRRRRLAVRQIHVTRREDRLAGFFVR